MKLAQVRALFIRKLTPPFVRAVTRGPVSGVIASPAPVEPPPTKQTCRACGSNKHVHLESSRTAYLWNGEGEDPNAPIPLCRPCAKIHHDNWDEQWKEVERGRL